jgi:hypothetical protein
MDCRVKPGNDDKRRSSIPRHERTASLTPEGKSFDAALLAVSLIEGSLISGAASPTWSPFESFAIEKPIAPIERAMALAITASEMPSR